MQGQVKEEWLRLCERAAVEQDSKKLMALIREITQTLDKKEERLQQGSPDDAKPHPRQ